MKDTHQGSRLSDLEIGKPKSEKLAEHPAILEELAKLSKAQSAALQQAAYFRMTANEAAEYDARAKRIGELCSLAKDFKPRR